MPARIKRKRQNYFKNRTDYAENPRKGRYPDSVERFLFSGSKDNFVSCLSNILPGQRISFEIPAVSAPEKAGNYQVVVTTPEGKKAAAKPMVLTAPVSETAYREYKNKRGALIAEKARD